MISTKNLRVLVVDDTIVYRTAVSDIIKEIPGVELAGVAHNGKIALAKILALKPDILTLDIEMPEMNGIEVLVELQKNHPGIGAIMLSTLTAEGSDMTMRALELGAFDFILKPQSKNQIEGKKEIRAALEPILKAFAKSRYAPSLISSRGRIPGSPPLPPSSALCQPPRRNTGFQTPNRKTNSRATRKVGNCRHRDLHRRTECS